MLTRCDELVTRELRDVPTCTQAVHGPNRIISEICMPVMTRTLNPAVRTCHSNCRVVVGSSKWCVVGKMKYKWEMGKRVRSCIGDIV